jgi:hypothetical protein
MFEIEFVLHLIYNDINVFCCIEENMFEIEFVLHLIYNDINAFCCIESSRVLNWFGVMNVYFHLYFQFCSLVHEIYGQKAWQMIWNALILYGLILYLPHHILYYI